MALTKEQEAVVNADFKDILIINAYAGTGKTSTLIKFCEARKDKKILYLSYNSSMRKEAEEKFKHLKNVEVKTMHSLAYVEMKVNEKFKDRLGSLRAMDMLPLLEEIKKELKNIYATYILRLVRIYCNTGKDMNTFLSDFSQNPSEYDINPKANIKYICSKVHDFWEKIDTSSFSYEHDFYLKKYQETKKKLDYDYILVDEAQDINACVIDIVLNQKHSKKVFIGDTYQSIYKFRGAVNSLDILSKEKDVVILYLTRSFRCPESISKVANLYLKALKAPRDFIGISKAKKDKLKQKAIVCRTNALLLDIAIENLDKKLFLVGGIDSYNFDDILDVQNLLFKKHEYIKSPFLKKFDEIKDLISYIDETNEIEFKQKVFTVFKYANQNILNLIKNIQKSCVNKQEKADLILSTAHKSKGLEWDNVELMSDFLNLKTELEKVEAFAKLQVPKEELNLLYVAITRAKNSLNIDEEYLLDEDFLEENKERIVLI